MKVTEWSPSAALISMLKEEEMYVAWPYDDKAAWRNGKPIEYKGGKLKGTLTQGYGHTAAAGGRKIVLGVHWSLSEAEAVFRDDLARFIPQFKKECIGLVGNQGQFDAIFSAYYNLTNKSFRQLIAPWKKGNPEGTYAKFPLYVMSGGERMRGLVRRREKEMNLWRSGAAIAVSMDAGRAGQDIAPEKVDNPNALSGKQKLAIAGGIASAAVGGAGAGSDPSAVTSAFTQVQQTADAVLPIATTIQTITTGFDIKVLLGIAAGAVLVTGAIWAYNKWFR